MDKTATTLRAESVDRHSTHSAVCETIAGLGVEDLVQQFGSPLYIFCERTLRETIRTYQAAFQRRYPNVVFAWSYKTNYLKAICGIMHQEGAGAEVVSAMEWDKAALLGVPGSRIVLNGPHKPIELLEQAITANACINADHFEELTDLAMLAARRNKPVGVGIRINLDAGASSSWSRFGFNLDSGEAYEAVRRIQENENLFLRGLHCHLGTQVLDPSAYARQAEALLRFAYGVEDKFGSRIEYLDLGGGFASQIQPRSGHPTDLVHPPSGEDYADQICRALKQNLRPGHEPTLILESGRALIDEAGWVAMTVLARKQLPDGKTGIVVDAGVNLLSMAQNFRFRFRPARDIGTPLSRCSIYGPLCMNIDVIDEATLLPHVERGDRLVAWPVGAYNLSQAFPFIHYRPAAVMITSDSTPILIQQREELTGVDQRDVLPEQYRPSF